MAQRPALRTRDRWFPWFVVSVGALAASLGFLAFVVVDAVTDGKTQVGASSPEPGETAVPEAGNGLTYAGPIPRGAEALALKPAEAGKAPDIEFVAGAGDGAVALRYFVPVASTGAGVDALTSEELRRIWSLEITDWADVGGIERGIEILVPSAADRDIYPELAADESGYRFVDGYAELRNEMSVDSGVMAIVPLEELTPEMVAIAVEGVDLARGFGDAAQWPLAEYVQVVGRTSKGKAEAEAIKASLAAKLPDIVRVVATGDVLQSRCSLAAIRASGDWAAALRGPVAEYLAAADLALSSLDGSIQGIAEPFGCIQTTNLTSPPEVIEALTLAGIDGMTVATNHAFDCADAGCGSKALLESITRLNAAGIKTVGGGGNLEEALAPAIFEVKGVRFGVLGFDDIAAEDLEATETEPGTAPLDDSYENEKAHEPAEPAFYKPAELLGLTRLEARVKALKEQVDVVIVQVQSGTEDTHTPSPRSIKGLRAAADAGADLVVGNQAHWVQAAEVRGGTFVAYALGNFVFDQTHTPEHTQGYLLEMTFHGKKPATVRLVPYQIEQKYRPVFATGTLRTKIIGDVVEASATLP